MLLKKNAVDLELDLIDFFALLVIVHSHRELVAIVRKIIWDMKGLSKALGMPTLLGLAIDVKSDNSTSQVAFN